MLRLSDRGIPPHMLHLYETKSAPSSKTEFQDDAVRLPRALIVFSAAVLARLRAFGSAPKSEAIVPESAKSTKNAGRETQYLGETPLRDTRWHAS